MIEFAVVAVVLLLIFVLPVLLRRRNRARVGAMLDRNDGATANFGGIGGFDPTGAGAAGSLEDRIAQAVQQAMAGVQAGVAGSGMGAGPIGAGGLAVSLNLAVAEVLSVSSAATGTPLATLELDAIGAPKRRVTAEPAPGQSLERGQRLYVLLDPADPSTVSVAPLSMTGGQTLPEGSNRLDALVLGPQILQQGAKGKGVVKSAESTPLANPALAGRGFSKWMLTIEVTPERGWPFTAELTTSLSTPEKAARIAHAGAEVPIRYDPDDTKTIAIDSVALGYGDPYAQVQAMAGAPSVTVRTTIVGGADKIEQIKMMRAMVPGMSLSAAKTMVEQAEAANLSFDQLRAQVQAAQLRS